MASGLRGEPPRASGVPRRKCLGTENPDNSWEEEPARLDRTVEAARRKESGGGHEAHAIGVGLNESLVSAF